MVQSEVGAELSPPHSSLPSEAQKLWELLAATPEHPKCHRNDKALSLCKQFLRHLTLGCWNFLSLGRNKVFRPILNQKHLSIPAIQRILRFGAFAKHLECCRKMNYLPFLVSNPDVMSGKTLNPVNYFCLPRFHQSFASLSSKKITPFTLERGNKDDGCFLEFIFAVSINIPLIAHHSWRGAWWSQLLLTENIWQFFFSPQLAVQKELFLFE